MAKKLGIGCLGIIGLFVLLIVVVVVASPSSKSRQDNPSSASFSGPAAQRESSGSETEPQSDAATERTETNQSSAPAAARAAPQRGPDVVFAEPVVFTSGGVTTVGVLVTNTTDQVLSFTAKATYKTGDNIAATASGAVNDLLPKQRRAANLLGTAPIPSTYDSVRVEVDTMVSRRANTPGATAASKITFGTPSVRSAGGLTTVDMEVTNGDTSPHSFMVQLAMLQDDTLVGVASGAVNDIAAGQTKTASLLTSGQVPGGAEFVPAIDTVVR